MALLIHSLKIKKYPLLCNYIHSTGYNFGKYCAEKNLKECYRVLGIPENSDQDKIRSAYLNLAKKYHPDTKSHLADSGNFQEIDKAFRILINKKNREKWEMEEINIDEVQKEIDIKHCVPQHRQYLSYEGSGHGTIFEREKQFCKTKAVRAAQNIIDHRYKKITIDTSEKSVWKSRQKHAIATKYGFERVVEDLIQEAMKKGEFNNLKGCGKPLPCTAEHCNPYVDFVTHKLNQVLIDNGFTPEWIMLQKEIRREKQNLKRNLYVERKKFGEYPLDETEIFSWGKVFKKYNKIANNINKMITKYNLIVPTLQTQILQVSFEKQAEKILKYGQTRHDVAVLHKKSDEHQKNPQNIFSFIESFILKNRRY